MTTSTFVALLSAWLAFGLAALSPGPNMVAVASTALGSGRRAAFLVTAGIATGAFVWSLATAYGLSQLFTHYPKLLRIVSCIGGCYLLFLGYKGLRAAVRGGSANIQARPEQTGTRAYLHGITVTATNPKVALFWASVSTFVTSTSPTAPMLVLFSVAVAIKASLIYGSYSYIFSTEQSNRLYHKMQRLFEASFGLIFVILGTVCIIWQAP